MNDFLRRLPRLDAQLDASPRPRPFCGLCGGSNNLGYHSCAPHEPGNEKPVPLSPGDEQLRASYERTLDVLHDQTRRVTALLELYGYQLRASYSTHEQQRSLDAVDVAQREALALLVEAGR